MSSFSAHCQIYIRESNGVSYQYKYMQQQVLSNLLAEVLGNHLSSKIRALYKGRLLELEQTLKQNKVKPNEIIHLINLSRDKEQNGSIYLSFEDKIYKVNFYVEESVKDLKERIQQQTSVPQSQQIILTNSIQLENSKMLKDYEIRNGDFLCMAQAKQRKPLVLDLPQIIFPKINKFDKRRGSQCITQKNEPVRVTKNSIIFEQCGNARKQNEKLVLSCTTPQSANLQYGPSPLSEYDSSFKNCMENWMGMQPETISQRFIQEAYWNEVGSRFDNSKEEQHRLKDTQDLTPVVFDSYFEDNQGLCESEVFDEMGNQHPTLSNVELTRSQPYSKIIPKFVYSTEIESPTKKL